MNSPLLHSMAALACAIASLACPLSTKAAPNPDDWRQLSAVGGGTQSRLAFCHWPNDKYPQLQELTPKTKTVLLDLDGPGVVTLFHVSKYHGGDPAQLILRVWYDREAKPAIEMPWMDFLGDVEAKTAHFSTVYFSHVKESHSFRLPMPFRKHIRIEVENPTDSGFGGYTDIQWEKVRSLPAATGYLRVDYRSGTPKKSFEMPFHSCVYYYSRRP